MKLPALILLSSLTITACDAAVDGESCDLSHGLQIAAPLDAPDVYFRETPYAAYISKWDNDSISSKDFADAAVVCADVKDPQWLLTLSSYKPAGSTSDERVIGLGGSAMASGKWLDCMMKIWSSNGAIQF